jgi:hypothetical protein
MFKLCEGKSYKKEYETKMENTKKERKGRRKKNIVPKKEKLPPYHNYFFYVGNNRSKSTVLSMFRFIPVTQNSLNVTPTSMYINMYAHRNFLVYSGKKDGNRLLY